MAIAPQEELPHSIQVRYRAGQSTARAFRFSTLLAAILYLLYFNIEPGAPFRLGGHPPAGLIRAENHLAEFDVRMSRAAGDGNLELQFSGSPQVRDANAVLLTEMYYNWNYLRYPHRVIVGKADHVINGPAGLFGIDEVPDDAWLNDHGVKSVFTIIASSQLPLDSVTRSVR